MTIYLVQNYLISSKVITKGQEFHQKAYIEKNQVNNIVNYPTPKELPSNIYNFTHCSPYFEGREETIAEIDRAVVKCKPEIHVFKRIIVLQGFGGMGKTELARAYAQRNHKNYDYILWIDAQTELSLKSSFKKIAETLGVTFKDVSDVAFVYQKLSSTYNSGNASTWPSGIKIINLDRLSHDQTLKCVRKYLHIENQQIPPTLENTIVSISTKLQGYPLALSLVCFRLDELAKDISNYEIESRIKGYVETLEDMPIKGVYDESDYTNRVKHILEETVKKINAKKNGHTALELLKIMSYLSPDRIKRKLLYAILFSKSYDGDEPLKIMDRDFQNAFVLLQTFSLVRIENEENVIIHRLIQESSRELSTEETLTTILKFFEGNPNNYRWQGHMKIIYNALIDGTCVGNKNYFLSMLAWKFFSEEFFLGLDIDGLKECLKYGTSDERFILCATEFYANSHKPLVGSSLNIYFDLTKQILRLTPEFLRNPWVLQCCSSILNVYNSFYKSTVSTVSTNSTIFYTELEKLTEHRTLISDVIVLLLNNYKHLLNTNRRISGHGLLYFWYGPWSAWGLNLKPDVEFLLELVTRSDQRTRRVLWSNDLNEKNKDRNFPVELISDCGVEIFTRSLQADNVNGRSMCEYLRACLTHVVRNKEAALMLTESQQFLDELSEAWKYFDSHFPVWSDFLQLVFIWVSLFTYDMRIFNNFKEEFKQKMKVAKKYDRFLNCFPISLRIENMLKKLSEFADKLQKSGHELRLAEYLYDFIKLPRGFLSLITKDGRFKSPSLFPSYN
ncbi:unnamed protein product [Allacma fusca]|uniref:DUF7779 domain-containing protein n=1 Tax=Allacma fusca TaxID=39272 RepID=A0A8J2JAG1_9HEXA|nr:unnamed protein product [Allacma fusca]